MSAFGGKADMAFCGANSGGGGDGFRLIAGVSRPRRSISEN